MISLLSCDHVNTCMSSSSCLSLRLWSRHQSPRESPGDSPLTHRRGQHPSCHRLYAHRNRRWYKAARSERENIKKNKFHRSFSHPNVEASVLSANCTWAVMWTSDVKQYHVFTGSDKSQGHMNSTAVNNLLFLCYTKDFYTFCVCIFFFYLHRSVVCCVNGLQ